MAYESWSVDGYNLSSLAHDIQTYDGLDDFPDVNVEDIDKPQDHGVMPGIPYFGAARKAVKMNINTTRANGTTGATEDARRGIFYENLDILTRVFYRRQLLDVQRTLPDGTVRRAYCRTITGIKPTTLGLSAGSVTFDLQVPAGFWEDVNTITSAQYAAGTAFAVTEFAAATAPLNELEFDIIGPYTNPRITDPETGAYVQLNATTTGSGAVTLKNKDQTVVGASLSAVTHQGDSKWLTLYPSPTGVLVTFAGGDAGARLVVRGKRRYLR